MLRITALMDNKLTANRELTAEHGLSLLLRYNGRRILFDCGASGSFLHNAQALGENLCRLDAVILSHSHYDHAAGFRALAEAGLGGSILFTGPHFFEPKISRSGDGFLDRSAGFDREFLRAKGVCHREVILHDEIFPGVHLIGGFPSEHPLEQIPEKFCRITPEGCRQDDFADEICMALEVSGGLAVLVGCAHPGIVNMLRHVNTTLGMPVRAVFGGTHLADADDARLRYTVDSLQHLGVEIIGFSHCSGEAAVTLASSLPGIRSPYLGCGDSFTID